MSRCIARFALLLSSGKKSHSELLEFIARIAFEVKMLMRWTHSKTIIYRKGATQWLRFYSSLSVASIWTVDRISKLISKKPHSERIVQNMRDVLQRRLLQISSALEIGFSWLGIWMKINNRLVVALNFASFPFGLPPLMAQFILWFSFASTHRPWTVCVEWLNNGVATN